MTVAVVSVPISNKPSVSFVPPGPLPLSDGAVLLLSPPPPPPPPHPKARRVGMATSPPPSHVLPLTRHWLPLCVTVRGGGGCCRGLGLSWSKGGGINDNDGRHCCHHHQLWSSTAAATMPLPQPPSAATAVNDATIDTVAAAAADAAATTPSPLPPPSSSLQPLPTSLRLQCLCRWLVVVSSVAPCLLHRPPSDMVTHIYCCGVGVSW